MQGPLKHKALSLFVMATVFVGCRTSNFNSVENPETPARKAPTEVAPSPQPTVPVVTPTPLLPVADKPKDKPVTSKPEGPSGAETKPIAPLPGLLPKPASALQETFTQKGTKGDIDILVVVDDSDSMAEEQENLSTKLADLLKEIQGSSWQIGVITTTVKVENDIDACFMDVIRSTDSNADERFRRAVTVGTLGSNNEEGIRQAANGLRCLSHPWVRPDSSVAVLIVSDADNCTNDGVGCEKQPQNTEKYLIHFLENDMQRTIGVNAGFFGIIASENSRCKVEAPSTQYRRLVNYNATVPDSNWGDICDASYQATLQNLSKNMAQLLTSQFHLKAAPVDGTVVISGKKTNGQAISDRDYTVAGAVITFTKGAEPALNSDIVVNYKVAAE